MGPAGAWTADLLLAHRGHRQRIVAAAHPRLRAAPRGAIRTWPAGRARSPNASAASFLSAQASGCSSLEPLVGLPAAWGGTPAFLVAKGLSALTAKLGEQPAYWIDWALLRVALVAGLWLSFRSLALEKPLWHFARPGRFPVPWAQTCRASVSCAARTSPTTLIDSPDRSRGRPAPCGGQGRARRRSASSRPIPMPSPRPSRRSRTRTICSATTTCPRPNCCSQAPPGAGGQARQAGPGAQCAPARSVLDDFNVKGAITEVRPGRSSPCTSWSPRPASRRAASSSWPTTSPATCRRSRPRVATIPGRSVIGIELPNVNRESVVLHQLITEPPFAEQPRPQLPIILGKNIFGEPIVGRPGRHAASARRGHHRRRASRWA